MTLSVLVTAPSAEPVTLAEVKAWGRIDTSADDAMLDSAIKAARVYVERILGRALCEQTRRINLDRWPAGTGPHGPVIQPPRPPLRSVTSIAYIDENGDEQTLAADQYRVDTDSEPGRITPAWGVSWPVTRGITNAITVTYVCGYAPGGESPTDYAANVPEDFRTAVKMLAAHWYDNPEAVVRGSISKELEFSLGALLDADRIYGF